MEVINISKKRLTNLKSLELPENLFNAEGELFTFEYKRETKLLKKLNDIESIRFANKLYTLESLNTNKQYMPNNFITPEFLVSINKQIEAFTMKFVSGINLSQILNNPSINLEEKKYYLKRVGQILEQMKNIRKYTPLTDFYLGDLHEDNFIVNTSQSEIYVVDLDSCKIAGNQSPIAKYLTPMALLNYVKGKYKIDLETSYLTSYVVDENTDIYCYIIMILNYLYNGKINNVELDTFYDFLNYLDSIKVSLELLECFNRIIINGNNENPVNYLDSLTPRQISLARTYTRMKK